MTLYLPATFFDNTQQHNIGPYMEQHCCWPLLWTVAGNNVASCMGAFRDSFLVQVTTHVWSEVCVKTTKRTTFIMKSTKVQTLGTI